jgi:quinol monooxygenase YgiN
MIHVIATIQTQPGKRAALLDAFRALVPIVHQEAGCIEYGPTIDCDSGIDRQPATREDVVTVVEKWEDADALKAHLSAEHMKTFRGQVGALIVGIEIRTLQPAN